MKLAPSHRQPIAGEDKLVAGRRAQAIEVLDGVAIGFAGREDEGVIAVAAIDDVDACAAVQTVIAVAAIERVGARIAVQHIVVLAAIKGVVAIAA